MVKSYYKWELDKTIGVVASPQAPIHYDAEGKRVITASLSDLNIWNLKKNILEKLIKKSGKKSNITSIAFNQTSSRIAVGFQNGRRIRRNEFRWTLFCCSNFIFQQW
jgi:WD40 repeat protein